MAKKEKYRYQLVHVWGLVEPSFYGGARTWEHLEKNLLELFKSDNYDPDESGVFFIRLTAKGRLKDICSFSGGYMDEMRAKADAEAKV